MNYMIKNPKPKHKEGDYCPACRTNKELKRMKNVGRLLLKKGIYGEFLGCNKYPGCKYSTKK